MKRVVITGMGAITSVGMNCDTIWQSVKNGKHNFTKITKYDTEPTGVIYAGQIENFTAEDYGISKKEQRRMDKFTQYAVAASVEAVEMAGYKPEDFDEYRVGTLIGSGIGGFETIHIEHKKYIEKGPNRVSVFFIPMMIGNMAAGMVAMKHGFKGQNMDVVTACASSTNAIGEAFRAIRHGYLDACIVGGSEYTLDEFPIAGFNNMGALSRGTDADRISIPFDKERNGFVMSDGAGLLFLEEYEHAKNRGAKILGEIVGYGATADAYHITSPDLEGNAASKCMEFAVKDAGINMNQIGYINAHGTSTPLNDQCETIAIKKAFGEHAKDIAVSSTKGVTGHLLGAAGGVEAIICLKALQDGVVPMTAGYKVSDENCDLDYVVDKSREKHIQYALSNSLGFGGHNATICFKKFED